MASSSSTAAILSQLSGGSPSVQLGTVTSIRDPATGNVVGTPSYTTTYLPGVIIDGAVTEIVCRSTQDYPFPTVGERVLVQRLRSACYVIGVIPINTTGSQTVSDTGWVDLGSSNYANWTKSSLNWRFVQGTVQLHLIFQRANATFGSTSTWTTDMTSLHLPDFARPLTVALVVPGTTADTNSTLQYRINTDGSIDMRNIGSGATPVNAFSQLDYAYPPK